MSCFAVYHDVPLPHGLPSSIHQGGVLMSRVLMSSTGYLVQTVTPVTGYATDVWEISLESKTFASLAVPTPLNVSFFYYV